MNNLQISDNDLWGNRFNGHDLHNYLNQRGVDSKQLVWTKRSEDPNTFEIVNNVKNKYYLQDVHRLIEQQLLLQSSLYPFAYELLFNKHFLAADIVHYHLIHNQFFNISLLPLLSKLKPAVWTLHDPWAMTGHCIHPFECIRWQTGCGDCPRLETEIALSQDTTALNWALKQFAYQHSEIDIVVGSVWMYQLAQQSPLLANFKIHHIPFGLNLDVFHPLDTAATRAQLGIPPECIVLTFRSTTWHLKGLHFIKDLLRRLNSVRPLCLLTFNESGLIDEFKDTYHMIELGWVEDEQTLVKAYNAADIVLMPSLAEAFGMTAMEAMACGKPVIVMDGTALPETVFAPEGGISVPQGNVGAFVHAVEHLLNHSEERLAMGRRARELACLHYDVNRYVDQILELYQEVLARRTHNPQAAFLISQLRQIELPRETTNLDSKLERIAHRMLNKRGFYIVKNTWAVKIVGWCYEHIVGWFYAHIYLSFIKLFQRVYRLFE